MPDTLKLQDPAPFAAFVTIDTLMKMTPGKMRRLLNLYPPYVGAGIRITRIADDWRELHVRMKMHWYNRNFVGTHFGGSLYSMVDPHLMLMLMQLLGRDYLVWDKAAEIDFLKATRRPVTAILEITDQDIEAIHAGTQDGEKYLPRFNVDITDDRGELVATVQKILYVRKKRNAG